MKKVYEYLIVDEYFETIEDLSKRINELGKEGWLLIHPRDGIMYFVRENREQEIANYYNGV